MQDIQLVNDGQLFPNTIPPSGGGGVVLDHRLRQTHHQNQALKCPRCDSLNTKFCYYNNYNLSQPRHFCKSCKRYWTKGGVLRNVPVGGGCRKSSKRSSAAPKYSKFLDEVRSKPKSNTSNSSSESSSLTGTGNAAVVVGDASGIAVAPSTSVATPPRPEAVSASFGAVFGFGDGKYIFPEIKNPIIGVQFANASECGGCDGGEGFSEMGNFSNLNNETATRNFSSASYDAVSAYDPYEQWQLNTEAGGGYADQTVQIDQHGSSNMGSDPPSWQTQQQQMFGLSSEGYWSEQQWSNTDNAHLYLP